MIFHQTAEAGIEEGLIRIAVGLEDVANIQTDLVRGLSLQSEKRDNGCYRTVFDAWGVKNN